MATFEQHVRIDAPVSRVWEMMTNPSTWEQWFPDVDTITNLTAVEQGAMFAWQEGEKQGSASIVDVDPNRGLIKVVTTEGEDQVTHTFDLDQTGGFFGFGGDDTNLKYRREFKADGGFIGEFVASGNPADAIDVKRTLDKIKRLAQG